MNMANIEVLKVNKVNSDGSLKAFVDLKIGSTEFRDFRVVKQDGEDAWVSPPTATWEDANGERKYKRLVVFPQHLRDEVSKAILAKWNGDSEDVDDEDIPF
jgi:DNA-binding cell septation regulator SpoVG